MPDIIGVFSYKFTARCLPSTNKKLSIDCFSSTHCLSSSLLPSSFIIFSLLTPDEDYVSKVLVFLIIPYVSLYRSVELF